MKQFALICNSKDCGGFRRKEDDFTPCIHQGDTRQGVMWKAQGFWPCPQDPNAIGVMHRNVNEQWVKV